MPSSQAMLVQDCEDEVQIISSGSHTRGRSSSEDSSVTIGREEMEEPLCLFDDEVIDLTTYESDIANPDLLREGEAPLLSFHITPGASICREDFIQVTPFLLGAYEIEFILVKMIAQDRGRSCKVRGLPFARTRKLLGKLPRKINEVCMISHIQHGSTAAQPYLMDVLTSSIVSKRRLIVTNSIYEEETYSPCIDFQHIVDKERQRQMVELHGHLVCRWKLTIYSHAGKPLETSIERISAEEVPESKYRMAEETICNRWRGGRVKGGSWCPASCDHHCVNVEPARTSGQKYTLFDSFSGAGGVSRGAQNAGFHIQGAVDKAPEVWPTYRLNFRAELFRMSVDEFIRTTVGRCMRADVLHLSPPCQYFSPAHTHESIHDDTNIFALFSCHQLIDKLRPRLITLEQTFGIAHDRHNHYFRALVADFTAQGYSVRWKIVRLCTWGLAQDRKRMIMIAAGPGDRLPPFPDATHAEGGAGGLRPFTTMRRAISGLRTGRDDLHDISTTKHYHPPRPPLNADALTGTITTGGSDAAYYPDGTRDFTVREYACLQGFPRSHRFRGTKTSIKRQIGNAFPPNTVRVLYQHLKEWLQKEDGVEADTVMVDDDEPILPGNGPMSAMGDAFGYHRSNGARANNDFVDLT